MVKRATNRFVQKDVSYKYLTADQQSFVDGLHAALETVEGLSGGDDLSELQTSVGDFIVDEIMQSDDSGRSEYLAAYDKIGKTVCKQSAEEICVALHNEIASYVDGFIGGMEDYEERRKEIDFRYETLQLKPDMTLIDDEGYTFGVISAIGNDENGELTCVIALEEPDEDGVPEMVLTADEVLTFTLCEPHPQYVSYVNGKKISHYKYGGDVEESIGD